MKRLIAIFFVLLFCVAVRAQAPIFVDQRTIGGGGTTGLPSAASARGRVYSVSDGIDPSDCKTGGGRARPHGCRSDGTKWVAWSAGTDEVQVDDYGAIADGVTDNQTVLQQAIDAVYNSGGGTVKFSRGKSYATKMLELRSNVTLDLNRATLVGLSSGANEVISVGANNGAINGSGITNTTLTTGAAGTTSLTVGSTTGFAANSRVIVSAGRFTLSGVEEGPIEFNEVASITDATHLVLKRPLAYSYSAFGYAGASAPKLYKLDPLSPKNARVTNGTFKTSATMLYFNIQSAEDIEIDHLYFENGITGSVIAEIGYTSRLRFHHNVMRGPGVAELNSGGMAYCEFTDNILNCDSDNNFGMEVATHDCLFARNIIGPVTKTSAAGIELSVGAFNNRIIDNRIFGSSADVTAGHATMGIRTYANNPLSSFGGNIIEGNQITDIMTAIGDSLVGSVISGNMIQNSTSHANSTGIITVGAPTGIIGNNNIGGVTYPTLKTDLSNAAYSQSAIVVAKMVEGKGDPEGMVAAPQGSTYHRLDGGVGTTFYTKESGGAANMGWTSTSGKNVALASNGGTASASSTTGGFPTTFLNDGNRKRGGTTIGTATFWNDGTASTFDDWAEIDFSATSIISEINVFTISDSPDPEPDQTSTFTTAGITNFTVQYWNGSSWIDLQTVTGNNRVWTQFTILGGISTDKVRVLVHDSADHTYSRIAEIEAWTGKGLSYVSAPSGTGSGVSSVFGRTGAVVAATNDYTWAQINKSTSSFADITTRSASDISSGSLADARLSANVPLLNAANTFTNTGVNSFAGSVNITSGFNLTWGGAFGANTPAFVGVSGAGAHLRFYPAGSTSGEQMRLDASGNLGLGTSSPSSAQGWNKFLHIKTTGSGASIELEDTSSRWAIASYLNALWFNKDASTAAMLIDSSGKVGIGTTSPGSTLHINGSVQVGSPTGGDKGAGSINAQAVYDDNVLLTDWVFRNYYRLRPQFAFTASTPSRRLFSLSETRTYTVTENRLPWMPTVSEFERARSLGGMVTRLWQGQEQQQIYIQQLEDRINALEALITNCAITAPHTERTRAGRHTKSMVPLSRNKRKN